MPRRFTSAPAVFANLLFLSVLTGCVSTQKIERADWGAIPEGEKVDVTTVNGSRTTLRTVAVYMDYLEGIEIGSDAGRSVRIPLDSIEYLEIRKRAVGPVVVLAAGVAAGVAIAAALGEDDTRPPPRPPLSGSCPLVYSFDGSDYVLDSETYSGAVAQGLERVDVDNLEHLEEVGRQYRLLMANRRPETQYTDELALLVLDHPEGTRALPDIEGSLHLLENLVPPISARGLSGDNALMEVRREDDMTWVGAPVYEADPSVDEDLRDGLEVTFPRPPGGNHYLVIRASNTPLAPFAVKEFLELQGEELIPWYRRLKNDSELRARVQEWVEREGWLQISAEVGGQWAPMGSIRDVGPNLPKTQVVPLDLRAEASGMVRIRIEAARGLWEVDAVMLGVGKPASDSGKLVEMESAQTRDGLDISHLLRESDGQYHTALDGDEVALTFDAPEPPSGGFTRSTFLRTRGFYHLHTRHSGAPRTRLVERILSEPLFGNRFLLLRWRAQDQSERR